MINSVDPTSFPGLLLNLFQRVTKIVKPASFYSNRILCQPKTSKVWLLIYNRKGSEKYHARLSSRSAAHRPSATPSLYNSTCRAWHPCMRTICLSHIGMTLSHRHERHYYTSAGKNPLTSVRDMTITNETYRPLPMKHISSVRRSGHRNAFFHNYLPPSLVKNPFFTVSRLIVGFSGCKRWHLSLIFPVNHVTNRIFP